MKSEEADDHRELEESSNCSQSNDCLDRAELVCFPGTNRSYLALEVMAKSTDCTRPNNVSTVLLSDTAAEVTLSGLASFPINSNAHCLTVVLREASNSERMLASFGCCPATAIKAAVTSRANHWFLSLLDRIENYE